MKKLTIILLLAITATGFSQGCLPEGITFSTQQQIDDFQTDYPGCTEIEGDVTIGGTDITNLNELSQLISFAGNLNIGDLENGNPLLNNLTGLDNVISIGGDLSIVNNDLLTNLSGLENLQFINHTLQVGIVGFGNPSLMSLQGLNKLGSIESSLNVFSNASLTNIEALSNLKSIGTSLSFIENETLHNLNGLENIKTLNGLLLIQDNDDLTDLNGLDSLYQVNTLRVFLNSNLEDFSGLNSLKYILGEMDIFENNSINSLSGLDSLIYIGDRLRIKGNSSLTDLLNLGSLSPNSISELHIYENNSLSDCQATSICNYLISPNGTVNIQNNATGCNSQAEIEEACPLGTNETEYLSDNIQIFPNPAKNTITILNSSNTKIQEVIIFNPSGKTILQKKGPVNTIDISGLQTGLYFVEVKTGMGDVRKKLIVE
ncbi:MAG: T9SS type A sorting domain-containing protein [Chlorobi bacterium]|nr:T9SS type A sorting domain-containing protein [Chlorobiota bacterium]